MSRACIRRGLIIAALAMMASGCSTWIVPGVAVEDRSVHPAERPRVLRAKNVTPARLPARASSFCPGRADDLIHPLHFDTGANKCPLLQWDIRVVRTGNGE